MTLSAVWRWIQLGAERIREEPVEADSRSAMTLNFFKKSNLTFLQNWVIIYRQRGAVAQLGERCVRNAQVGGSSPLCSSERRKEALTKASFIYIFVRVAGVTQG